MQNKSHRDIYCETYQKCAYAVVHVTLRAPCHHLFVGFPVDGHIWKPAIGKKLAEQERDNTVNKFAMKLVKMTKRLAIDLASTPLGATTQ